MNRAHDWHEGPFRIAATQIASVPGNVDRNVAVHAAAIAAAAQYDISALVFPELSLTGYEPELADGLAMTTDDDRLRPLLVLARQHRIDVVVGAPLRNETGQPFLGAILIRANAAASTYRKMHLGTSERPFFAPGDAPLAFPVSGHTVGIAICADSSRATHPQGYADLGADVYAAGVFLNAEWYETDVPRLGDHAARGRMLVLMANHAASVGTRVSVGKSAVWAPGGSMLAQAEGTEDALVIATKRGSDWRAEVRRI